MKSLFIYASFLIILLLIFVTSSYAADRYWVGSGNGNNTWDNNAASKWSTTSGGVGGASEPTADDDVFFDSNSPNYVELADQSLSGGQKCKSLNFTGFSGDIEGFGNSMVIQISGSLTFSPSTFYGALVNYTILRAGNLTFAGATPNGELYIDMTNPTDTCKLQDDMSFTQFGSYSTTFVISSGVFNANNHNITIETFMSSGNTTRSILMGSGTWEITSTGGEGTDVWMISGDNLTIVPDASTIKFTGSLNYWIYGSFGGKTYNNLWIATHGIDFFGINDANTFNNIRINPGRFVNFPSWQTTTFSSLTAIGAPGYFITISSSASHTLSCSSGIICCDYLKIEGSMATGGASFFAGANSVDMSNNSGWLFSSCTTSIPEGNMKTSFSIYPNPVSNELIIEPKNNMEKQSFDIYNSVGQITFSGELKGKTFVNTSNFASGVYLIKLLYGNGFEFKKFIKE